MLKSYEHLLLQVKKKFLNKKEKRKTVKAKRRKKETKFERKVFGIK